jgi:hypothetical protein
MKNITFLIIVLTVLLSSVYSQQTTILNQKQAVALAENFVVENGYTDKPPDTKKIILEKGEKQNNLKQILAKRLGSIESSPIIAYVKNINGQSVWLVRFLMNEQKLDRTHDSGREVRMSLDGKKIWINPELIEFDYAIIGDCLGEGEKKFNSKKKP